jgi:ABC-type antimicrobial peptide transport system permease subunit
MASLDNAQVADRFLPMTAFLDGSLSSDRFRAALVAVFGVTGLVLVVVGLGGSTARTVAERTRELGVRLALGAVPTRLWFTTTCGSLTSVMAGIAAGVVAAAMAFRVMSTVLAGVQQPSILLWGIEAALVAALCAVAAALPAYRVMAIDPIAALRPE